MRSFSLAYLCAHTLTPPQAVDVAAGAGYQFVGLRLLPSAPGGQWQPLISDAALLRETQARLRDTGVGIDPLDVVLTEGGPWHVRGRLLEYAERLRATGRGQWADVLLARHPREATGELPRSGF